MLGFQLGIGQLPPMVTIAALGDSLTFGYPLGANPYTARLGGRILRSCMNNVGVSGANVLSVYNTQVPQVCGLTDGDMSDSSTLCWDTTSPACTVTKEPGTPRWLKLTYSGNANPATYQRLTSIGNTYTISGYARSDGTYFPRIVVSGIGVIWTGTTSTSRQPFSVEWTAAGENVYLGSVMWGAGYVGYDSIELVGGATPSERAIVLVGVNDIAGDKTAVYVEGYLEDIYHWLSIAGYSVTAVKLTPWAGHVQSTAPRLAVTHAVNTWIDTAPYVRNVVDTSSMGDGGFNLLPAYDYGDGLHMSDAGYNQLGELICQAMMPL